MAKTTKKVPKRTTFQQAVDKGKKALKAGERVSEAGHKYYNAATGKVQKSKGGRTYTENRPNRTDSDRRKKI